MSKDTIVLLNSEGDILTLKKVYDTRYIGLTITWFSVIDQHKQVIGTLSKEQVFNFTRGNLDLFDSKQRHFRYSNFPGSMKPDLKTLDEFIGVDTTNKTY